MSPLATTLSTSVPAPRLIVLKPAHCDAVIVTVSLPLLPVSVSMPETVPIEKSTVVAVVSTIWSRVPLPLLAPPWIDSPVTNWPLARLIVSSPRRRRWCRRRCRR